MIQRAPAVMHHQIVAGDRDRPKTTSDVAAVARSETNDGAEYVAGRRSNRNVISAAQIDRAFRYSIGSRAAQSMLRRRRRVYSGNAG